METMKPCTRPLDSGRMQNVSRRRPLELRAERLLAEYLRVWGFRDPQIIAVLAKQWVRRASEATGTDAQEPSRCDLYRAALGHATRLMTHRVNQISRHRAKTEYDAHSRRGLLAIELRSLIDEFPRELVNGDIPETVLDRLTLTSQRVVPPMRRTTMPVQSLQPATNARWQRWRSAPALAWQHVRYVLLSAFWAGG